MTVNGGSRAADATAFTPEEQALFARQGWLWADREGHYKGAAVASRGFTEKTLEGLFELERYRDAGYHQQDDLVLRRI